ncbi:hypothetical protein H5410_051064, partial [Solanum commersonii]
ASRRKVLNPIECSSVLSPEGKGQVCDEKEQSKGDELDQRADRRVCRRSRLTAPNSPSQHKFLNTINTCLNFVFELNEIPVVIGSSWFQLERVNPRPSPTLSARESEWAKAEVVLKCGNLVFKRNRVDS